MYIQNIRIWKNNFHYLFSIFLNVSNKLFYMLPTKATMKKKTMMELHRISCEQFKEACKIPLVVILDDIRSLNNVGSIFRTSDAFVVECIILCGITATPPHPDIHKTALGAEDSVNWIYMEKVTDAIDMLHERGYTVCSIEQVNGSISLDDFNVENGKKYAVILGNEVKGVQQQAVDMSDYCIEIPQYGTKHSLNVSISAGIVIWQFFNKMKLFTKL